MYAKRETTQFESVRRCCRLNGLAECRRSLGRRFGWDHMLVGVAQTNSVHRDWAPFLVFDARESLWVASNWTLFVTVIRCN